jgi:membrane complex biogenesis BtpA family protein
MPTWLSECFTVEKPIIGMLHAPPLPGAPRYAGSWPDILNHVLWDADELVSGGIHGLILENYGDAPFFPRRVPPHVTASLTALAVAVKTRFNVPLGINVLRNDGQSALGIAVAAGAQFIRVNVLCGARVTDQGLIEAVAYDLLRERRALGADSIRILADVNVKHSAPLAPRSVADEVEDLLTRGGADAVIVTGAATGQAVDLVELQQVQQAVAGRAPVLVGSGVCASNIASLRPYADAFIVGSSLKHDSRPENPVDAQRVKALCNDQGTASRKRMTQ